MADSVDWGSVVRADMDNTDDILDVPVLTDEMLDSFAEDDDKAHEQALYEPGSMVEHDVCGKTVKVKKDGTLTAHKCEPKAQRGNRFDTIPERKRKPTPIRVREVSINLIAWSVEEGTAAALARPFHVDPSTVPTELPDAEEMIGPILDIVWPSIPEGAQKLIAKLADESELISCGLAWMEWARTLGKWTREQRAYQQSLVDRNTANGASQFTRAAHGSTVVPFQPIADQ